MMNKEFITNNFPEVWENQYSLFKDESLEITFYSDTNEFYLWEGLYHLDITDFMKTILNFKEE